MTTQTHWNRLKLRILLPIPYLFAIYLEVNDNEDVNDAISNTGRKQRSDGKKSYFAECRICGKKGRRDKIKYHVKSTHSIFATSYKDVYICQKVVNTVQGFAL